MILVTYVIKFTFNSFLISCLTIFIELLFL